MMDGVGPKDILDGRVRRETRSEQAHFIDEL